MMSTWRMTNWLLLGIFLVLLARLLGFSVDVPSVVADTLWLDRCITERPSEKPASYVHVVTHNFAGD